MLRKRTLARATMAGCLLVATTSGNGARHLRLVLLVTVDTLRTDRLGAYASPLALTPNLDRLAAESQVFTAAFTPASSTLPSISALMTSRYPEELGMTSNGGVVPRRLPRLARWLLDRGWATGAVVSNYVLRRKAGLARGFSVYDVRLTQREGRRSIRERRGPETTQAALRVLDELAQGSRPVFLWVHYQDPHGPYVPPETQRARTLAHERASPDGLRQLPLSGSLSGQGGLPLYQEVEGHRQVAFYRAGYNGEVAVVDEAIGKLIEGVAQRRLLDDAVVVLTADHGESLGEDDYWFAHGERISHGLVHVPLMVRAPGRPPARREELASLLDVFPTIAALTGGRAPRTVRGRDLLSDAPPPGAVYLSTLDTAAAPRRGVVSGAFQYIRWEDLDGAHEQLYALSDQRAERAAQEPATVQRLRGRLAAEQASLLVPPNGSQRQALRPEEVERLGALGYVALR